MEFRYESGGKVYTLRLDRDGDGYRAVIDGREYAIRNIQAGQADSGTLTFRLDGQWVTAHTAQTGESRLVALGADVYTLSPAKTRRRAATGGGNENLTAPMNGQVVRVLVSEGEAVSAGQPLVILEAMKMEIRATAPHDGQVARLLVAPGQVVERGQSLLELTGQPA